MCFRFRQHLCKRNSFLSGINPRRKVQRLKNDEIEKIIKNTKKILKIQLDLEGQP